MIALLASLLLRLPQDDPTPPTPPPTARLVDFDALQKAMGDADLRLLDARPRDQYDAGHIPGAVWVDVAAAEELAARPGGLRDREAWEAWAGPLALGPDTRVLVYDASRQLAAARVWWLLTYLGVRDAGLVDGGFGLWKEQGRPVSAERPQVEPGTFRVAFRDDRHADRDAVLANLKSGEARVLDARSPAEHSGAEKRSSRGGRIPDACPLEWKELVDAEGRFLDEATLREKIRGAGVEPGDRIIAHCQGGGRASVDAFVLERLGFPTRNYYLGWSDWGNAEDVPVETGPPDRD
jgi:thiosulfate/3-mercaptopyruvate sulfurtransferase